MTALPPDVRTALRALLGLALACVVLAGLYTNPYLFLDPFGRGLPDVSPTAGQLVLCFQVGAALCGLWANVLVLLATPGRARTLGQWAQRASGASRPLVWSLALGVSAAYAAARIALNEETVHATLAMLTEGTALLPFQYRALVPWMVRALHSVLPSVPLPALYGALEAVAAVGVWQAMAYLLRALGRTPGEARLGALATFVPLAFTLVAPWRYNAIFFPYDTPSVAFFALGLGLIVRGRWTAYYPLLVLATLNRETSCFLVVAFVALGWGRMPVRQLAAHALAQTLLWVGLKAGLGALYASNEALGEIGLFASMIPRSGRILTAVPGWVYLALIPMGGWATLAWLLRHRVTDGRLRRMAWIVPPFVAGMVVVGELMEVRIYSELIPLVTAAVLAAVAHLVREASSAPAAPAPGRRTAASAPGRRRRQRLRATG